MTSAFTNGGQIEVAAGATFMGSNPIFVNEGTLAGRGSYATHVNGDIVNRGAIIPGTAGTTGLLSFVGDLDLDEATPGTLNFDLASLTDFDVIAVSDDVTLGGGIVVSNAGYNAVIGDRFVVLTFDQRVGGATFTGLTTQGFGAGVAFNVIYNLHDVTLEVAAVPEPETWGMLLAGLGMVGVAVRRRRLRMA
ncbi:MAG: PEPxxWA-CTERM sorting domain-containing protein [Thiobacillus sp.]|nr:PEPxxWA-CTERM sorting domain-containing protein [Thiobacillus sp.]